MHLSYFKGRDHRVQMVGQKYLAYIDSATTLGLIHRLDLKRDSVSATDGFDDVFGIWGAVTKPRKNENNNLTWKMPVDVGFRYLVRIHFCDLELHPVETGVPIFKVLIDELIVDTNIDIVKQQDKQSILWYRDYMVAIKGRKQDGKQDLLISLQSDEFMDRDKLIKGFEIFKLSNHDNSLASPNALPLATDSPSSNLLSLMFHGNATTTITTTILILINIIIYTLREIWEANIPEEEENRPSARSEQLCRRFSLHEIHSATKNFSEAFLIGCGGFGKVYKGLINNGQQTVAIKRLKSNSNQGKHEFLTEIETLSELRHINIVSLIGYCSDQREMVLVYEYMPSGTLADHLYKHSRGGNNPSFLNWKQLLNICIGAGRGIDYLHTGHGVIHHDVKTSNILLDENFVVKVSDFGLAKTDDKSRLQSHISTMVKGTFGYLDPYYLRTGKLTRKSDTYAFGVVLLEVLCGRNVMDPALGEDEYFLIGWARNKISAGEFNQIIASSLMGEISPDSLKVFIEVAEKCLHAEPKERPTMAQVVVQLESALEQQDRRNVALPNHMTHVANDIRPSNEVTMSSVSTEQLTEASQDVQTVAAYPPIQQTNLNHYSTVGGKDGRKLKTYKPLQFSSWSTFWNRLKSSKKKEVSLLSEIVEADISVPKFDFIQIAAATNQFSSAQKIGESGFGSVYKALLPTGRIAAVKRFSSSGPNLNRFKHDILMTSRLHHQNIIELLGYCIHEQGILLYELMEKGSLNKFIFDELRRRQLQWSIRFKIINGIAKGVTYLHQESGVKIIHRNLKPTIILLDFEMNPKISGFGIAKSFDDDQSEMETMAGGTIDYIAPEYHAQGRISEKIDVYSFGIMILEILSGKKNMGYPRYDLNLIEHTWKLWKEGNMLSLVDVYLSGAFSEEEAERCIQVGLLCTQYAPDQRPTMPVVLKMLLGEDLSLQEKIAKAASHKPNKKIR